MARFMPLACVVVGLGLAVGFGAMALDSALDYRAFPSAPVPITVARLAAMTTVPRGTWVSVIDAQPDCRHGYAKPQDTAYVLLGDGQTRSLVIAALNEAPSCQQLTRAHFTGVPSLRRTVEGAPGKDVPYGLAWPGVDWQTWPGHRAVVLWTWSGPGDSRIGIWLGLGFSLLGLLLTAYGARWLRPRVGDTFVVDPSQFPETLQLKQRGGASLPARVVWLPVIRAQAVTARGLATDVTLYELELPANATPLATQRTFSAHTGPGHAGLIFRSAARDAVAAALAAGSSTFVLLRSDLAELEQSKQSRAALCARHLRLA